MSDDDTVSTEQSAEKRPRRRRGLRIAIWGVIGVAAVLALAGSVVYTEQSSFCPTCHEMRPYYVAWQTGGHATRANCVDCHVDPGLVAHLLHKPSELKELWDHFFVDNRFPNYGVEVSNARCVNCHATVVTKSVSTFSHKEHEKRGTCQQCHATTAHSVSLASLQAAGVLKAAATTVPVPGGLSPSSIVGHKAVACQRCHDQARMKCTACHQAPHEPRGECSNCHAPGAKFSFVHGGAGADCSECHTAPANHYGAGCSSCHSVGVPFKNTTFTHPARVGAHNYRSFPCAKCHPKDFTTSSCTCHGGKAPTGD